MSPVSRFSRFAGLLIGDLIVGVEGYRAENLDQYRAVNAFFEQDDMKLTVWRGDKLLPIALTAANRTIDVELRSYPLEGYREK
jgi:S1-C subfamily serine protease